MPNKEIEKIEKEIETARQQKAAEEERMAQELAAMLQAYDDRIAALQAQRDEIALQEKLRDYPADLVASHQTCSICGDVMRPFTLRRGDGGNVKIWACRGGNLSDTYDKVIVE